MITKTEITNSLDLLLARKNHSHILSKADVEEIKFLKGMELHDKLITSLDYSLKSNKSFTLSGKPGTGKSVFLKFFKHLAKVKKINYAIVAPTGVAAIAVSGQTIHSFFNFDFGIQGNESAYGISDEKMKVMRQIDVILIDEYSMVRADILDGMSFALRYARGSVEPFGGVQMIFVGDLFQIPPVLKPEVLEYLKSKKYMGGKPFHSKQFIELAPEKIIFDHVYRQDEKEFLELLDRMREGVSTSEDIKRLNSNSNPVDDEKAVYLCTTKKSVAKKNEMALKKLEGKTYKSNATVEGEFPKTSHPTEQELHLKVGCRLMLLCNSYEENAYFVNGDLGTLTEVIEDNVFGYNEITRLIVTLDRTGEDVEVDKHTWDNTQYVIEENEETKEKTIISKIIGSFIQFPCMLGYALTIHKAQGKTLDHVVIDLGRGAFAYGQSYVGVSRCTSLETLHFIRPIQAVDIFADPEVVSYLQGKVDVDLDKDEDSIQKLFERLMDAIEIVEKKNNGSIFISEELKMDFAFQASEELLKSIKFDSLS